MKYSQEILDLLANESWEPWRVKKFLNMARRRGAKLAQEAESAVEYSAAVSGVKQSIGVAKELLAIALLVEAVAPTEDRTPKIQINLNVDRKLGQLPIEGVPDGEARDNNDSGNGTRLREDIPSRDADPHPGLAEAEPEDRTDPTEPEAGG